MADIDRIQIQIEASSGKAADQIKRLSGELNNLKQALNGTANESKKGVVPKIEGSAAEKITNLATALKSLKDVGKVGSYSGLANSLSELSGALKGISTESTSKLMRVGNALKYFSEAGKAKINAQLPEQLVMLSAALNELKDSDADKLKRIGEGIQSLTADSKANVAISGIASLSRFLDTVDGKEGRISSVASSLKKIAGIDFSNIETASEGISKIADSYRDLQTTVSKKSISTPIEANVSDTKETQSKSVEGISEKLDDAKEKLELISRIKAKLHINSDDISDAQKKLRQLNELFGDSSGFIKSGFSSILNLTKTMMIAPFRRLGDQIKQTYKSVNNLYRSIARIAMYRALRTVIKSITDALKVGINNLYQYSKTINSDFHLSMNSVTTDALYLKNSLATIAEPIINIVAPAFRALADEVANVISLISQLMALLGGSGVYTRAIRQTTEFSKATGGAAKAMEPFLAAFDEINRLPDDSKGGGGGSAADYAGMFEEVAIDSEIKSFFDRVKAAIIGEDWDTLGEILGGKIDELFNKVPWEKLGTKIGKALNGIIKTEYSTLKSINFSNWGRKIASSLNNAISEIESETYGRLFVEKITSILDFVIGFIDELDFFQLGEKIGDFFRGALDEATEWLSKYEWKEIGKKFGSKIADLISGINFGDLARRFWTFFKKALSSSVNLLSGIFDKLEEEFGPVMLLIESVGAAILSWKLSIDFIQSIINLKEKFEKLSESIGIVKNTLKTVSGLIAITLGAVWSFDAGYEIAKGEASVTDYIKAIAGPIAAGVGGALIGSSIPGIGTAVGFGIGLTLGIVFEVAGFFKGAKERVIDKFYESDFGQQLKTLQDDIEKTNQIRLELNARIDSITGTVDPKILADLSLAQQLLDEIFSIDANKNLTATEMEEIRLKVETLNSLGFDNLQASIDETTGHVIQTKQELQGVIDTLLEQYRVEAMRDAYIEAYRAQYDATIALSKANGELTTAMEEYKKAENSATEASDKFKNAQKELYEALGAPDLQGITIDYAELQESIYQASLKVNDSNVALEEAKKTLDNAQKGVVEMQTTLTEATEKVDLITGSFQNLVSEMSNSAEPAFEDGKMVMEGFGNGIKDGASSAVTEMENATDLILQAERMKNGIASPSTVYKEEGVFLMQGLANGISEYSYIPVQAMTLACGEINGALVSSFEGISSTTTEIWGGISSAIITSFTSILPALQEEWRKISEWWSELTLPAFKIQIPKFYITGTFDIDSKRTPNVNVIWETYETGGFPEDGMFFANHGELVGKFANGKTAVANNEQIVAGISAGVENANEGVINALVAAANMIVGAIDAKDTDVVIDGKKLARTLNPYTEKLKSYRSASFVTGG